MKYRTIPIASFSRDFSAAPNEKPALRRRCGMRQLIDDDDLLMMRHHRSRAAGICNINENAFC